MWHIAIADSFFLCVNNLKAAQFQRLMAAADAANAQRQRPEQQSEAAMQQNA
jgi:hypothetical protein